MNDRPVVPKSVEPPAASAPGPKQPYQAPILVKQASVQQITHRAPASPPR